MNGRAFTALAGREWRTAWNGRQGYVERGVYVAMLVLGTIIAWCVAAFSGRVGPWNHAEFARILFADFFLGQLLLALFLATVSCSQAMVREKERASLDLLILSPLSGIGILLGKSVGRLATMLAFLVAGVPVFFFLVPMGGVSVAEVISVHLLLAGWLAAVTGVCALLGSWFSSMAATLLVAIAGVGTWLLLPMVGREAWPEAAESWRILEAFNALNLLNRELASIGPDFAISGGVAAGGFGIMVVLCIAGGLILEVRNERRKSRSRDRGVLLTWMKRMEGAASSRAVRTVFRPLFSARDPLTRRECSMEGDVILRVGWMAFASVFVAFLLALAFVPMGNNEMWEYWLSFGGIAAFSAIAFLSVRGALAVSLDRSRGVFEALLAANVEPDDIVKSRVAGMAFRASYFVAIPVASMIVIVPMLFPLFESVAWIVRGLIGMAVGVLSAMLLTLKISLKSRGVITAVGSSPVPAVVLACVVFVTITASWFTLALAAPLWIALCYSMYASIVRQFRQAVLVQ